ncbi:TM1812 family CRISPR-associated protein [Methanopyrus kandleri]|uniref:Uncharacterized protein specific for M.kandleri, MK-19 family n=2 Tax=Methanopyrus kandleri TaxID=2320 RepID=Q8TWV9_METKA|nr:TM1812 family CRISPR-associated protein [Methanopyrus kandleri]AAM02135.1 Uncharacterized protein specific for M.kandleri, MK-19 family [Methanopyrus kandleri AV19]HII69850.1 hypothetical protein [Methanopyrus kandleri]
MPVHAVVGFGYPKYDPVSWFAERSLIETLEVKTAESRCLELREGSTLRLEARRLGRREMSATALLERVEEPGEVHVFASSSLKGQTVDGDTVEDRMGEYLVDPLNDVGFEVEVHWSSAFDPLSLLPELIDTLTRLDDRVVLDLTHGVRIQPAISAVAGMAAARLPGSDMELVPVYGAAGVEVREVLRWSDGADGSRGIILDIRRHLESAMAFNKVVDYTLDPSREHLEELCELTESALRELDVPDDRLERVRELVIDEGALRGLADALRSNYPRKVVKEARKWEPKSPEDVLDRLHIESSGRERAEKYLRALSNFLARALNPFLQGLDLPKSPWKAAVQLAEWLCDRGYYAASVLLLRELVYLRTVYEWAEEHGHGELKEVVEEYLRALIDPDARKPRGVYDELCSTIEEVTDGEAGDPDDLVRKIEREILNR